MPYSPELKVVGWTSSYKSVQVVLKDMKKEKFSEDAAAACLDSIAMLCASAGLNPDEIVALGKSHRSKTTDTFLAYLDRLKVTKDEVNFRLACVIDFLALNKAF